MVNNETQKENEMALEDVLAQKWVDSAKEISTLRVENDRLEDEAYTARQSAKGENALRLEAERERDTLRAELASEKKMHGIAKAFHDLAIADRNLADNKLLNAERERDTLRTQLEDHRLAHDDAKAAWENECSERDIAEEKLEAAERDLE